MTTALLTIACGVLLIFAICVVAFLVLVVSIARTFTVPDDDLDHEMINRRVP